MVKHGKFSKTDKKGGPSMDRTVQWVPLVGALIGVSILTGGLICLYLVMRTVGLENGGSCVSGGPYEIAPGHECGPGVFELGFGGGFALIVGFLILLWSSHRYGGPLVVTSASGLAWSAFWGGLGGSFLSIGSEMPDASEVGLEFKTVGTIFLVLATLGLFAALGPIPYAMRTERLDYPRPTAGAWIAWFAAIVAAIGIGIAAVEFARTVFY